MLVWLRAPRLTVLAGEFDVQGEATIGIGRRPDAPVVRLASIDTPVPYSPPLEDYYLPQVNDVVEAARKLAAY